jgi:hypothetical protein
MQHERLDPEPLAAFELLGESRRRFLPERGVRSGGVDQVRGVRDDREESRVRARGAELRGLGVREFLPDPAVGVLDENLEDAAAGSEGPFDGMGRAPGDRVVSADGEIGVSDDRLGTRDSRLTSGTVPDPDSRTVRGRSPAGSLRRSGA